MRTVDIFTVPSTGHTPSLSDYLQHLSFDACTLLLEKEVASPNEIANAIKSLSKSRSKDLASAASLIVRINELDGGQVRKIGKDSNVRPTKDEFPDAYITRLVLTLGVAEAKKKFGAALRSHHISPSGEFAEFTIDGIKLDEINDEKFKADLEKSLSMRLGREDEPRRVLARIKRHGTEAVVGLHFAGLMADGPELNEHGLTISKFKQSATATFFYLNQHNANVRILQRSYRTNDAECIRQALGDVLRGDSYAVSAKPISAYKLDRFREHTDALSIPRDLSDYVTRIALEHVVLTTANNNKITLKTKERKGNALSDLQALSKNASFLTHKSAIDSIGLVLYKGEIPSLIRVARATVSPASVACSVHYFPIVRKLLQAWEIAQ